MAIASSAKSYQDENLVLLDKLLKIDYDGEPTEDELAYRRSLLSFMEVSGPNIKIVLAVEMIGVLVGLVMTTLGFRLWYTRVQRYQDSILSYESGIKLKELQSDNTSKQV
ncbi:MAG: hypothetical protein HRU15_02435 [Planctomycetes bacterium]|nr:hypothetical protein [Planctomycetota bacterium]